MQTKKCRLASGEKLWAKDFIFSKTDFQIESHNCYNRSQTYQHVRMQRILFLWALNEKVTDEWTSDKQRCYNFTKGEIIRNSVPPDRRALHQKIMTWDQGSVPSCQFTGNPEDREHAELLVNMQSARSRLWEFL